MTVSSGSPPGYRWRKNGSSLSDGGNVSGATNATLTLANVLKADAGSYSVVVTNSSNSVTSQAATLTVIDPAINSQPVDQMTARLGARRCSRLAQRARLL